MSRKTLNDPGEEYEKVDRDKPATISVWSPPKVWEDPPVDRRRWNALISVVPPWTRVFLACMQNPGRWAVLCTTNRPEGITWRVKKGLYGATASGKWKATQRSVGGGFSRVWVMCEDPPPSVPGGEP